MGIQTKQATLYITDDGSEFLNKEEAMKHDDKISMTAIIDRFYWKGISLEDVVEGVLENLNDIKEFW